MASYILRGSKQRGKKVGRVHVADDRVLVLDGPAVVLTDDEFSNLDVYFRLEESADFQPYEPTGNEPDADESDEPDDNENDNPQHT